jgi:tetratricopeptide (TPR) repeat protein
MSNSYALAAALTERGHHDQAWKVLAPLLNDNPNDVAALICAGYIMVRKGAFPQAYHFSKSATRLAPYDDGAWQNLAEAAQKLCLMDEAEDALRQALRCAKSDANKLALFLNLSAVYVDKGDWSQAEKAVRRVLELDPTNRAALANLGFCQLAKHEWAEGWKNYHNTIGSDWRKKISYRDEPEWDGSPGKTVVVYADQGIGDEISFASMISDAAARCKKLILDCDGRLEHLFRRSFPNVRVYGTRIKDQKWASADRDIDASLSIGQLGEFVRTSGVDFTGRPYLVACPTRLEQWRQYFGPVAYKPKLKPVVGIAWTGGVPHTNSRNRRVSLNDLLPVLSLDAHFVSLQYKDAHEEIEAFKSEHPEVDLVQYTWATLTDDYDNTAALVAACDYVLCIQTAVARTAGALGVPCSVLVPTSSNWFYSNTETVPWHASLRVIRQQRAGSWDREIALAAERIADQFGLSSGAGEATRGRKLRHGVDPIRAHGRADHHANGGHAPS